MERLFIDVMVQWPIPLPGNVNSAERVFEEKILHATEQIKASYEKLLKEQIEMAFRQGKDSMWKFHIREKNSLAHSFGKNMRNYISAEIEKSEQNKLSREYIDGLKFTLEAIAW